MSFHEFPSLSYIINSVTRTVVIASSIAQGIFYFSSDTFLYPASPKESTYLPQTNSKGL